MSPSLLLASASVVDSPGTWLPWLLVGLLLGLALLQWRRSHALAVLVRQAQLRLREMSGAASMTSSATSRQSPERSLETNLTKLESHLRASKDAAEQNERLLYTLMDAAPMAVLLLEEVGTIAYSNEAARALFFEGRPLGQVNFLTLLERAPAPLRDAVLDAEDRLFTVDQAGTAESYHLAKRHFSLSGTTFTLLMVKHLTRELRRQEVDVWKRLIRVLTHELNNSLAPVSSLVHSARALLKLGKTERLDTVFETIEERALHLRDFVEGYARFARLPPPRREHVNLAVFLEQIALLSPRARVQPAGIASAYFDKGQLEQVLINLLKNALESESPEAEIELSSAVEADGTTRFEVVDRGQGMSEQVLESAMLPFFSTKERGSGLGLALCREIIEAHGGSILLENRSGGGLRVTCTLPGFTRPAPAEGGKLTLSHLT